MKKIILFTTALFLGFSVLSAQPCANRMKAQAQKPGFSQKANFQSNFSEEQLVKMKELRLEYAKNSLEIKNKLKVLTAEYHGMMTGEKQDLNAINKKIDQMQELKTQLFKMSTKHKLDVRNLMSEEQKIQIDSRMSKGQGNSRPAGCRMQAQGKPGAGRGPCGR